MFKSTVWLLALFAVACGGAEERPLPGRPAPVEPFDDDHSGVSQPAGKPAGDAPAPVTKNADGPHISRSAGDQGGLVVFWPRVIPKADDAKTRALAKKLQERLVALGEKKFGGKVDVRPEPERVCPKSGCEAATLGVLFVHGDGGCTAVALVSKPGKSPARLVPWAGVVTLKADEVPFREYPENQVSIRDAVPCDDFLDALGKRDMDIEAAL